MRSSPQHSVSLLRSLFLLFPLLFLCHFGTTGTKREEEDTRTPFQIAINNYHFTDSPTPSIYLSTTYTTPYLYCRSFNKNKNDRTTTTSTHPPNQFEPKRKETTKKSGQFRRFLFIFLDLVTWSSFSIHSIWRWLAYTMQQSSTNIFIWI